MVLLLCMTGLFRLLLIGDLLSLSKGRGAVKGAPERAGLYTGTVGGADKALHTP